MLANLTRPGARAVPLSLRSFYQRRAISQPSLSAYLVTPSELSQALESNRQSRLSTLPRIVPLCASWFLPNDPQQRTGQQVFREARIPGARFFDLDAVKDPDSPYPHMLPSAQDFARAVARLGVRREDTVVVYDSKELGIFSAPRVAWTFKVFGHPGVHVLNNFKIWCEEGHPLEEGEPEAVREAEYPVPEADLSKVVAFEEVREIAKEQGKEGAEEVQILDARSEGRWKGVEDEPRAGLSSGHMPHSYSFPAPVFLDPNTKAFLPAEELKRVFEEKGIDPSKPVITTCGTGVTATIIDTALQEAGFPEDGRRVYDGSWTEWAQRVKPTEGLIRKKD